MTSTSTSLFRPWFGVPYRQSSVQRIIRIAAPSFWSDEKAPRVDRVGGQPPQSRSRQQRLVARSDLSERLGLLRSDLSERLGPLLPGQVCGHRNTALLTLARDVPPVVLADLLGLHPNTAERWLTPGRR